ncbi:DedA family protein [Actinobacteria bacterium YIM 96077]|uniref:DedA family protein n=1 Tax=Phytoactinopolyspora halophila TaxID=1981511 RepID=A0A329QZ70_9ACTN|nr:DedA family protein [Phytoactinopolyspora halophila]AYY13246.1 DedA family protein [Actinobacteria bacterium YIM 96077]RAW17517.1 DedA family protein [Phytoactinopolyspora halophila]
MSEALGEFGDAILEIAHSAMSSPWIYVVILVFAAIDSVLPVIPAETLVITAGVFAASGVPSLALVIVSASAGAYLGDHMAYGIGHVAGRRIYHRSEADSKRRAAFSWAHRHLQERGGLILVVCRQIPGGRTAVTLTAGTVSYPLRKFSFFEIFAALSWGLYGALIGYFGGLTFGEEPLKGLALGFSIAITISVIVEVTRFWIQRRRRKMAGPPALETGSGGPQTSSETTTPG